MTIVLSTEAVLKNRRRDKFIQCLIGGYAGKNNMGFRFVIWALLACVTMVFSTEVLKNSRRRGKMMPGMEHAQMLQQKQEVFRQRVREVAFGCDGAEWLDMGCEDEGDKDELTSSEIVDESTQDGDLHFVIRDQGSSENQLTPSEVGLVRRYYRMNRARLTLRLILNLKGTLTRNVFVLAVLEDKIVGFCQVVLNEGRWYVWNLMRRRRYLQASSMKERVIKKLTKGHYGGAPASIRGVGGRLLEHAESFVRKEAGSGTTLFLDIKSKFSRVLQPYYESLGYECTNCDLWFHFTVYHFEKVLE